MVNEMETGSEKEAQAPLSLDEFRKLQNNFWLHFKEGFWRNLNKENPYYRKFAEKNPDLESRLIRSMEEAGNCVEGKKRPPENSPYRDFFDRGWDSMAGADTILPIYEEMYEAYKIMRAYAGKDEEMGIRSRKELKRKEGLS